MNDEELNPYEEEELAKFLSMGPTQLVQQELDAIKDDFTSEQVGAFARSVLAYTSANNSDPLLNSMMQAGANLLGFAVLGLLEVKSNDLET